MSIEPRSSDIDILSSYHVLEPMVPVTGVCKDSHEVIEQGDEEVNEGPLILPFYKVSHTPYNRTHNTELIAVLKEGKEEKLTSVKTANVTRWNVFLSWFGLGKLAKIKLSIKDVSSYLAQFNWKDFKNNEPESRQYKAYVTVCKLAGLQMLHHKDGRNSFHLWRSLSDPVQTSHGAFRINPATTYRHICYLARLQGKTWSDLSKENGQLPASTQPMTSIEQIEEYTKEIIPEDKQPPWL